MNWKQYSTPRNVVITIFVFCLAYAAFCQSTNRTTNSTTRTTTAKWYTLLEDNPAYVQNFMSKMMSKYPQGDEKPLRDYTGVELGPNLGYEPYWKNFPDTAWEQKCSRCPELFEKYKTVCAIDSSGEVLVNITMCNVLKQNCLSGIVYGHSTGIRNDFQGQYFAVASGWARVAFRQNFSAVIQLSTFADNATGDRYTIEIDTYNGWWSCIKRNDWNQLWYRTIDYNYRALVPGEYAEFVMRWNASSGWLLVTSVALANWTQGFHLNYTDPNPFPIKYIAVGGMYGQTGDWIIKGLMVTNFDACADSVVAVPLVTSATEPAVIYSEHHPINVAYFKRINEVGWFDNMTFHTREEY